MVRAWCARACGNMSRCNGRSARSPTSFRGVFRHIARRCGRIDRPLPWRFANRTFARSMHAR
eukprot:1578895-Lingulodinium_polyedra.AAC.1